MEWNPANEIFYFAGHQLLLSDRRLSGNCFNSECIRFANVRFESSSLRFVEMEFGDSLEINDRAEGNVFKFSSSLGFLSKNFFIFRKGIEEYCIHLNKSSVCPQFSRRPHSFHLFFCPNFIGNTVAIFRWKLKFQKLLHRKRSAIGTGKLISRFDETR